MINKDSATSDTHSISVSKKENAKTPLYKQLAARLKKEINSSYKAGDTLPAESKLAKDFEVNRHTIHRAINELMIQGYVMCHQGKRTEVLDKQLLKYALDIGKFTEGINRLGKQSITKVVMTKTIQPVPQVLKSLFESVPKSQATLNNVSLNKKIFRKERLKNNTFKDGHNADAEYLIFIRTLRVVDDQPITIIDHYLNPVYVPDIAELYQEGSLHDCIKAHYGYELIRANAQISARLPKLDEANYLDCHSNQPLLIVDSVQWNKHDINQIVEVSVSHTRADRMTINI